MNGTNQNRNAQNMVVVGCIFLLVIGTFIRNLDFRHAKKPTSSPEKG